MSAILSDTKANFFFNL